MWETFFGKLLLVGGCQKKFQEILPYRGKIGEKHGKVNMKEW